MSEILVGTLSVDAVNAIQSVSELKQVIRDAKDEALKFGAGSVEFTKFGQIAATAKEKLNDLNKSLIVLNPEARTRAFGQMGQALIGGFTGATAAASLFGAQTEDVQKQLLKVQAALGLLQGFEAIREGAKAFEVLRLSIVSVGGAITALGIPALIALFQLLVSWFDKTKDAIIGTTEAMTDHQVEVAKLNLEYQYLTGAITDTQRALGELDIEYKKALNALQIETEEKLKKATGFWSAFWSFIKGGTAGQAKDAADTAIAIFTEQNKKEQELAEENELKKKNIQQKANNDAAKANFDHGTEMQYIQEFFFDQQIKTTEDTEKLKTKAVKEGVDERLKNLKDEQAARANLARALLSSEQSFFTAVTNIGQLTIRNQQKLEQFQKKAALVKVIIDQAVALSSSIKSAMDLPFPANLVAIASSIASITTIFVSIKGLLSKAGDSGSVTLDTVSAPSIGGAGNIATPSQITTLIGQGNQGNSDQNTPTRQPVIVKIVESDITSVQANVASIQDQAVLGG